MRFLPVRKEAVDLFRDGAVALSYSEAAGMRVDTEFLNGQIKEVSGLMEEKEEALRESPEYSALKRRFGVDASVGSREQLAEVMAADFDYKFTKYNKGAGKPKPVMDDSVLEEINTPYCETLRELEKLKKLHGTYLIGIKREVCDGFLHAVCNLNMVVSFRSSYSDPNFQNFPIRDPSISWRIRKAFIPREGHVIVDGDYSSQEVRVACNLSLDEKLIQDTLDGDMHRDMAAECFKLPINEVSKALRGTAKGGFVFAEFYGDWYKQVARNLWGSVTKEKLKTASGKCVIEHLAEKGIHGLGICRNDKQPEPGTFEEHIKQVEHRFWHERFYKYHEYRQRLIKDYAQDGYIELVTGFVCSGLYKKNQIINYPVQGPAFHCLLWAFTRLTKEMRRRKMRSVLLGQIHDSIVGDIHKNELEDYLKMFKRICIDDIAKAWKWITVPLAVEVEVGERNWHEKKSVSLT
jgi:DNA polymerase-1